MSTQSPEILVRRHTKSARDIRAWVLREMARALQVDSSTINTAAPLDSLGLDSLAAIGMTGGLAGWLNRDLPATLLWEYASIDALAEGLADAKADRARAGVVDLQPEGDRTPIFFFPGIGGHPVSFAALATELGLEQPCFGMIVPGFEPDETPLPRVEDIVAAILNKVRLIQPRGPYQLAGYSFGGLLAYEAAQQLTAAGETVSLLAIYDTYTPSGWVVRPAWQRLALHGYLFATRPNRLRYLRDRVKRYRDSRARAAAKKIVEVPIEPRNAVAKAVTASNTRAARIYKPTPYAGSVVLFRASDHPTHQIFYKVDPSNGWGAVARGGVTILDLPGSHVGLLSAKYAALAAGKLRPYLSATA